MVEKSALGDPVPGCSVALAVHLMYKGYQDIERQKFAFIKIFKFAFIEIVHGKGDPVQTQ